MHVAMFVYIVKALYKDRQSRETVAPKMLMRTSVFTEWGYPIYSLHGVTRGVASTYGSCGCFTKFFLKFLQFLAGIKET